MNMGDDEVHGSHCCVRHGCKYGDSDCPVASARIEQLYPCEDCSPSLAVVDPVVVQEIPNNDESLIEVGQWYWCKSNTLVCVVHVGSNYVKVRSVDHGTSSSRVHLDAFDTEYRREWNPDAHISEQIRKLQSQLSGLMTEVQQLTSRLSLSENPALVSGGETQALSLRGSAEPVEEYKNALARAKKEELPALFDAIERTNQDLSTWMRASLIPLEAQAHAYKPLLRRIEDRIFSVELYAGLTESAVKVRDGDPAGNNEKIRLHQRRCYMDEECLVAYKTGGMEFNGIPEFDKWLSESENFERIFPFPRSVVAFRVRRNTKDRHGNTLFDYIRILEDSKTDESTFLYARNGDRLYRISTSIDFGHELFPDSAQNLMGEKLYARVFAGRLDGVIPERQYLGMVEEEDAREAERVEKLRRAPESDRWHLERGIHRESEFYQLFSRESVYYDDILARLQAEMNEHNRLVLVLQGLLDRSEVFHPHPAWSLWDHAGFAAALELVYDSSRALTSGPAPDFESYRRKLNSTLTRGSITIGQELAWEVHEAEKENDRAARDWRTQQSSYRHQRFRPYGDPGPGLLARVVSVQPKQKTATFAWEKDRISRNSDPDSKTRRTFTCPTSLVLNVGAYIPGDYKRFFADPRTRAEYLKWAPFMLEAEEYHAGNRTVAPPPPPQAPKKPSREGQRKYAQKKAREFYQGKPVRLVRDILLKNGKTMSAGSLWEVTGSRGSQFNVRSLDHEDSESTRYINGLSTRDFELDSGDS